MEEDAASPASSTNRGSDTGSVGSSSDSAASAAGSRVESVIRRLVNGGVPENCAERGPDGLVEYIKEDRSRAAGAVFALFPDQSELREPHSLADDQQVTACRTAFLGLCVEAAYWAQWLMFERDPKEGFADNSVVSSGTRGICGAVWGSNDIAYRCRTCGHDPTCAICVPCFKAGDHRNHDYAMIRTGGGCCDCGDATAWKRSGFCRYHRGPGHAPALPLNFTSAAGPVLESVLSMWVSRLAKAFLKAEGRPKKWLAMSVEEKVASQTSLAVLKMLLELCHAGESMLNFTAEYVGKEKIGVIEALLKTEFYMTKHVIDSSHELLYKLLGDTNFKHTFASKFIHQYPKFIREAISEELSNASGNTSGSKFRDQAILSNFSVQIFTVPTLTPKLVVESKLLDMLTTVLRDCIVGCVGEDGRITVSKGQVIAKLYTRVTEDIRYVMTHFEVAQYITTQRKDLCKAWLELLACVQGMQPQKRVTSIHVEEESDDWDTGYRFEVQVASIHPLYVLGAASVACRITREESMPLGLRDGQHFYLDDDDDDDNVLVRHAKVGRISPKEMSDRDLPSTSGADVEMADVTGASFAGADYDNLREVSFGAKCRDSGVPGYSTIALSSPALFWLITEALVILEKWLALDNWREVSKGPGKTAAEAGHGPVRQHAGNLWRGRARGLTRIAPRAAGGAEPSVPAVTPPAVIEGEGGPGRGLREWLRRSRRPHAALDTVEEERRNMRVALASSSPTDTTDMEVDTSVVSDTGRSRSASGTAWWMFTDDGSFLTKSGQSISDDWPKVDFDVSRQDVSVHLPLHRMLSLLLHKALELQSPLHEESVTVDQKHSRDNGSASHLKQLLPPRFQTPSFICHLLEHPLRLQVLCAQVQAGMWRRNGHPTSTICDLYRTVPWCEDSLELDLLMLQCCAVMAPPERFVEQIQSRFGLADYFTLFPCRPNEYESTLAQEFLVLLIRIGSERGFCGLTQNESLRRELVQRLAVGDATHSSLLKALPRRLQDNQYLQECLKAVASYRNPSSMQQGKYALKDECWCELDLYHPRWSPRELQSAEERYLRACKSSPVFLQLPRWKAPFAPLQWLGRFLVTRAVHDVLLSIFYHAAYSTNSSDSRATEGLLFTALHLLSLGLEVCSKVPYNPDSNNSSGGHVSGQEALDRSFGSEYRNSFDCTVSSSGSTSTRVESFTVPALLSCAIVRKAMSGGNRSDGDTTEGASLLSLLVTLMRKYGSGEVVMGAAVESSQHSAADLIKSLLLKFVALNRACMYEIELMVPEILHRPSAALISSAGSYPTVDKDTEDKQGATDAEKRKALARERQKAAMAKMRAAQEKFISSLQDENKDSEQKLDSVVPDQRKEKEVVSGEASADVESTLCSLCRDTGSSSPLCFLTLVQKSRLLALAEKPTPSWERTSAANGASVSDRSNDASSSAGESGNAEMYTTVDLWNWIQDALGDADTRERLLQGEAFLEVFTNGLHPGFRFNALRAAHLMGTPQARAVEPVASEGDEVEGMGEGDFDPSVESASMNWWEQDSDLNSSEDATSTRDTYFATVLAEYVGVVTRERRRQGGREVSRPVEVELVREGVPVRGRRVPVRSIVDSSVNAVTSDLLRSDTSGVYLSACGHAVHQDCLDRYFGSLLQRYYSRALFEGVQIVDPDMGEFLCPVCRRLANSIVPEFPESVVSCLKVQGSWGEASVCAFPTYEASLVPEKEKCPRQFRLDRAFQLLSSAESLVYKSVLRKVAKTVLPDSIKGALDTLALRLFGLYHPGADHGSGQIAFGRVPQSLHLWDVLRYSIMSTELAARTRVAGVQGSLGGIVLLDEGGDGSKGSILPLLLQAAVASQAQNRQVVLLRARGLQLIVDSIVHGVTRDLVPERASGDKLASVHQYLEKSQESGDVQFWKRASDPVLTHNSFSSLVWLLFCLPLPPPAVEGPLIALVHLFYVVCLTQIVAYHGRALASKAEAGSTFLSFAAAVQAASSGASLVPQDEDNVNILSGSAVDVIRQLTLPFLRQCFLLRKLLSGGGQLLPVARAHMWEYSRTSSSSTSSKILDVRDAGKDSVAHDLEEVAQLESLFAIPDLTSLLADENTLGVILNWCRHARTSSAKDFQSKLLIPRPLRATPFRLMVLPHLFQDLLQRYVKERCQGCGNVPERPALCLLCGTLVCALTSRPCACSSLNKQGEFYKHAMMCGAGVGVFLNLRRTTILLQRCERQANWPSPYLDAHGEEDLEQRGKPLFLSEERYAALTAMVVSHGLDYSSLVLGQTTRHILW